MAKEAVARLFRAAQNDPILRQDLSTAADLEAFVKKANTLGYEFTVEEWREMTRFSVEELEGELSEIPGL
ncbi:MAG: Nif11-like leader peptide family natural product precursor [Leptolyngbya sp. SIO4C5]|uniref:Nif11-like leader peptide family natural product precursor n=1 Tax=Sphaerothrix gracilis TaxID=3151835 RepID=UPI0013C181AD|nr:Nif11-like leader peptide family natural product precursor [Leptolyngbya sp. SIO4C5]